MSQNSPVKPSGFKRTLAKASPSGIAVLLGYVAALLFIVARARKHSVVIPEAVGLGLICFSFGWAFLSMWKIVRGCRKLGYDRSNYTKLLSEPHPDDPDEFVIWLWTLQLCYAVFAALLCVAVFIFAA
jgi:hypothetical protein